MRNQLKHVAIELVDEPESPIRVQHDDAALDDLAQSIRMLGVIEPPVVEALNGRYRVIAGHRRLLAARRAGLATIPIVVRGDAEENRDAVMLQENIERLDLSPAEEARRIMAVYLACGEDIEKAAAHLKLTVQYCDGRLRLLAGDADVLAALDAGEISIGVADELNKITREDLRKTHLHDAKATGVNVRQAREWRLKANAFAQIQDLAVERGDLPASEAAAAPAPPVHSLDCEYCNSGEDLHLLRIYHLHPHCARALFSLHRRSREAE